MRSAAACSSAQRLEGSQALRDAGRAVQLTANGKRLPITGPGALDVAHPVHVAQALQRPAELAQRAQRPAEGHALVQPPPRLPIVAPFVRELGCRRDEPES